MVKTKSKFKWDFPFHNWPFHLNLLGLKAWEEAETHVREVLMYPLAPRMLRHLKLASYHSGHLLPRLWDWLSFYYGHLGHWISLFIFCNQKCIFPPHLLSLSHFLPFVIQCTHTQRDLQSSAIPPHALISLILTIQI